MENKTTKYFKYAIGEIILVVIGILIALQINNWNEHQKIKQEEAKLLNSLVNEIESNLTGVDSTIKSNEFILKRSSDILKKGLSNPEFTLSPYKMIASLGYNTNKYETSIINEILGTNSKSIISNENTIAQLRLLKQAYTKSDDTQFYSDEFWNQKITDYLSESGLGIYISSIDIDKSQRLDIKLDKKYYSLLGLMNGYQSALLMSRQDLKSTLNNTLLYLKADSK